ncbi:PREDICTED: ras-related protein Rab-32 [Mandrillus leucophaeus]|uniref:ras-related protein Rab-32 n=1 Tax=Mandrillus leucophaeus TaxID=9568 RepID=UPI0005F468CD|nr:PREDICTED: ras-related protein Rab-32 [Mandrillus leucophaeus]
MCEQLRGETWEWGTSPGGEEETAAAAAALSRKRGKDTKQKMLQVRIRILELLKAFSGKKGNSDKAQFHPYGVQSSIFPPTNSNSASWNNTCFHHEKQALLLASERAGPWTAGPPFLQSPLSPTRDQCWVWKTVSSAEELQLFATMYNLFPCSHTEEHMAEIFSTEFCNQFFLFIKTQSDSEDLHQVHPKGLLATQGKARRCGSPCGDSRTGCGFPGQRLPSLGAAAAPAPETREHLFKVLVIGELGVGKTSIIKRYVHQLFSQHYRATIGVDFALKVLNWDSRTLVRLQLWDIAGQERFGNMTRVYYKEAVGAFVVFDISRSSTFEAVLKWKSDLDSKVHLPNGSPIPAVLLANKCDQNKDSSQTPSQMDQFCKEHGFAGWFETSAKDNINIEEAARFLVEKILANHQSFPNEENDVGKIKLDQETLRAESKSQCC